MYFAFTCNIKFIEEMMVEDFTHILLFELQGETKILKLKNLRPQDYANYTCTASVRNVCGIPDKSILFQLTNKTGMKHNLNLSMSSYLCPVLWDPSWLTKPDGPAMDWPNIYNMLQ